MKRDQTEQANETLAQPRLLRPGDFVELAVQREFRLRAHALMVTLTALVAAPAIFIGRTDHRTHIDGEPGSLVNWPSTPEGWILLAFVAACATAIAASLTPANTLRIQLTEPGRALLVRCLFGRPLLRVRSTNVRLTHGLPLRFDFMLRIKGVTVPLDFHSVTVPSWTNLDELRPILEHIQGFEGPLLAPLEREPHVESIPSTRADLHTAREVRLSVSRFARVVMFRFGIMAAAAFGAAMAVEMPLANATVVVVMLALVWCTGAASCHCWADAFVDEHGLAVRVGRALPWTTSLFRGAVDARICHGLYGCCVDVGFLGPIGSEGTATLRVFLSREECEALVRAVRSQPSV